MPRSSDGACRSHRLDHLDRRKRPQPDHAAFSTSRADSRLPMAADHAEIDAPRPCGALPPTMRRHRRSVGGKIDRSSGRQPRSTPTIEAVLDLPRARDRPVAPRADGGRCQRGIDAERRWQLAHAYRRRVWSRSAAARLPGRGRCQAPRSIPPTWTRDLRRHRPSRRRLKRIFRALGRAPARTARHPAAHQLDPGVALRQAHGRAADRRAHGRVVATRFPEQSASSRSASSARSPAGSPRGSPAPRRQGLAVAKGVLSFRVHESPRIATRLRGTDAILVAANSHARPHLHRRSALLRNRDGCGRAGARASVPRRCRDRARTVRGRRTIDSIKIVHCGEIADAGREDRPVAPLQLIEA